jgi:hypothetical protein
VTLPLRTPRSRLNVDREALEFLGFTFVGEGDEAELESETFLDNAGAEQAVNRKNIITAVAAADGVRRLQHRRAVIARPLYEKAPH